MAKKKITGAELLKDFIQAILVALGLAYFGDIIPAIYTIGMISIGQAITIMLLLMGSGIVMEMIEPYINKRM